MKPTKENDICKCGHKRKAHICENESVMTACELCYCGQFKKAEGKKED